MPDVIQDQDFYFEIKDWKQGLNSNIPYFKSPINALTLATNAMINKRESLARRFTFTEAGHFNYPTVAGTPAAMMWVGPTASFTKRIIFALHWTSTLGLVRVYDGSAWTDGGGASSSSTAADLVNLAWVRESSGTEFVYASNPSGNMNKWTITATPSSTNIDGTVNTNPPQKCQFLINFLDRLWAGGKTDQNKDKLYYSKILVPETWDQTNNWISFGGQFGERITAVQPFRENQLFVATDQAVYLLSVGTSNNLLDWEQNIVTRDYGVLSNFTVVNTGDDVLFMDTYGDIRSLQRTISESSAGVKALPISFRIKDQLAYTSSIHKSAAAYFNGLYFLILATGANTRKVYVYDKAMDSWIGGDWTFSYQSNSVYPFIGLSTPVLGSVTTPPSSFSNFYLFGKDTVGSGGTYMLKLDDLEDITSNNDTMPSATAVTITADTQTVPLDFGFPQQAKILKWIEFEMFPQSISGGASRNFIVEGRKDTETSWTSIGTVDYSGSSSYKKQKLDLKALSRGKLFQLRIRKTDTGPKYEILRAVIAGHVFETRDN